MTRLVDRVLPSESTRIKRCYSHLTPALILTLILTTILLPTIDNDPCHSTTEENPNLHLSLSSVSSRSSWRNANLLNQPNLQSRFSLYLFSFNSNSVIIEVFHTLFKVQSRFNPGRRRYCNLKPIFPTPAPTFSTVFYRHISQWFDFNAGTDPKLYTREHLDGLRETVEHVHALIDPEIAAGIP
jgi:hypothetical protein